VRPEACRHRGFTLVEVIIVIAILSILAASLAPLVAGQLDQARRQATEDHLEALADALRSYQRDVDAFPPDTGVDVTDLGELKADTLGLTDWAGPYLTDQWATGDYALDAWGGTIDYNYGGGATVVLTSPGIDGTLATADDIALTVVRDYAAVQHRAEVTYETLKLVAGDVYGNNPNLAPTTYTIPAAWQTDDWGNNLIYVYNNDQSAVVYSWGPDGTGGGGGPTGDDIYFALVWSPPGGGGGGGSGGDADDVLTVVPGEIYQCGGNDELGIVFTNGDSVDLEITQIDVSWSFWWRNLQQVQSEGNASSCSGGTDVWDNWNCGTPNGDQSSPASLTVLCKTVQVGAGANYTFDEFDFDGGISGMDVTIVFTHQQVGGGPVHTSTVNVTVP
jgi:general secretion pathway protein G